MNIGVLKKKINKLFIVREDDGSYNLFGKFTIVPVNNLYKVLNLNEEKTYMFSSLKNAVTYCVFEKNNKKKETNRIIDLDESIGSLEMQILQYIRLLKKANDSNKEIYSAKITECKHKRALAIKELERYINDSKYYQTREFKENQQISSE